MLETWWNCDFGDILSGVQEKLQLKNKMDIPFLLMPVDEIQACAAPTGTKRQYIVAVTEGLRDKVFEDTNSTCIFDRSLEAMRRTYKCSDDLVFLRKALCITTWLLVVGHELGHVINGHLGDGVSLWFVKKEVSRLAWKPGDAITDEMRIYSVEEYDADVFPGVWAGILPSRLQITCDTKEDHDNLGMSLTCMAAQYLVTLLNTLGDGYPWYPPNSMRVITMTSCFLYSYDHVQKTGELPEFRLVKIEVDPLVSDLKYRTAVREVTQDLDAAGFPRIPFNEDIIKEWLQTLNDFYPKVLQTHDKMQNMINSS